MGMNWLITGGCGFLGTSLIRRLVSDGGHQIRIIDNLSVGTREDLAGIGDFVEIRAADLHCQPPLRMDDGWSEGIELVVGDILDDKLALLVAHGAEVIVHFAANTGVSPSVHDPRMDCMTNVIGTFNYLEAARKNGVKRFVFASSGAPVGEVDPPIHEELAPHPVSPYGASKLAGEGYCSAYFGAFGVETVALRFGNVYGPGSGHKSSVIAKFIKRALKGLPLVVYGDGFQTRDFIYIDDLINAVCCAATIPGVTGVFQIATQQETTVMDLLEALVAALKSRGLSEIAVKHEGRRTGDVRRNYSDTSKATRGLGWKSKVGLKEGLTRTVDWFLNQPQ